MQEPEALTIQQVATALSIHRSTVYDLIRDGKLKTIRIGKRQRVRRVDLMEYLEREAARAEAKAAKE